MKTNNKNKYETPVIIPLGELAKGSGICDTGSGGNPPGQPGQPHCYTGTGPPGDGGGIKKCGTGIGGKQK